jgi:hypothetical protein
MPRATVSMEPQHEDLKTCPGGYVEARRMSYGELMTSQDLAYQVQMRASQENPDDPEMGVTMSRIAVVEFQMKTCILDHNLDGDNGQKLDFKQARDVHLLDANVGQEIVQILDNMHNWQRQFPNSERSSLNGSSEERPARMAPEIERATGTASGDGTSAQESKSSPTS